MPITRYESTDSGAPILSGVTGSLNALLQAVLVTGYGSKPAAGWTRPFNDAASATSAFLSGGSDPKYLQIADGGQSAASFREARARLFTAMTTALAGTDPCPTVAQRATGYAIRKSSTLDSAARPWTILADNQRLVIITNSGDINGSNFIFYCGRIKSYKPGDLWNWLITGRALENSSAGLLTAEPLPLMQNGIVNIADIHLLRSYTAVNTPVQAGLTADLTKSGGTVNYYAGGIGIPYPQPVNGGLFMSPIFVHESTGMRGSLPGVWCPMHNRPVSNNDTWTAVVGLTSRSFLAKFIGTSAMLILETSDTWDI
jgi:hypothetical protein